MNWYVSVVFRSQLCALLVAMIVANSVEADDPTNDSRFVRTLLDNYCVRCHGQKKPKAELALHDLSITPNSHIELSSWKRIMEQLQDGVMPPEDEKQLSVADRERVIQWIKATLAANVRLSDLAPSQGNYVNHEALFSGKPAGDPATPARVWRMSKRSYEGFMRRLGDDLGVNVANHAGVLTRAPWASAGYSAAGRIGEAEVEHHLRNCQFITRQFVPRVEQNKSRIRSLSVVYQAGEGATADEIQVAVVESFKKMLRRSPETRELDEFGATLTRDLQQYEPAKAIERFLIAVLFHPDVLYRIEEPMEGQQRSIMPPRQLARAIAYSLTYSEPDDGLRKAVAEGRLSTREDVRREVERVVYATTPYGQEVNLTAEQQDKIDALHREHWKVQEKLYQEKLKRQSPAFKAREEKVREMRKTFHEQLKEFLTPQQANQWVQLQKAGYRTTDGEQINLTDLLRPRVLSFFQEYFEYVKAPDVFKCEITRQELEVSKNSNQNWRAGVYVKDADQLIGWLLEADEEVLRTALTTRKTFVVTSSLGRMKRRGADSLTPGWNTLESCLETYELSMTPEQWRLGEEKPLDMPAGHRLGILTHPSWLIAQSGNFDNHAIHRGQWIHEKLLGGRIPDVPITVDAKLPEEPENTLRHRMRVTREEYCWKCHKRMDALGLTFERFDHYGRYRTAEIVVDKEKTEQANISAAKPRVMTTKPFETGGAIIASGDPALDGPVNDAFELIERLAYSKRVEQVFVRHVFRYFMGRNETLADGPTLVAAHKAYRENGGSFNALLVSLLTSDSFLYRTTANHQGRFHETRSK